MSTSVDRIVWAIQSLTEAVDEFREVAKWFVNNFQDLLTGADNMPSQSGKSELFAKYGSRMDGAVKKHARDATRVGMQRVPPGITNGVARLVECGFGKVAEGKQNAGEFYFRAVGVVEKPRTVVVNGETLKSFGLQTSIMEMVCDTKTSTGKVTTHEEHVDAIMNYLRQLGGDEYTAEAQTLADLDELAKGLETADPPIYFNFSTSVRKGREYFDSKTKQKVMGEDGVWENWYKAVPDYSPEDPTAGVQDDSGRNGELQAGGEATVSDPDPDGALNGELSAGGEATVSDPDPDGALAELATKADAGDKKAQKELKQLAIEAGVAEDAIENADNWSAVFDLMQGSAGEGDGGGTEPEQETWEPAKGEIYNFTPLDKNGKPVLDAKKKPKVVEAEVMAVNKSKKTVYLLNNADKKTKYVGIKWDALSSAE